MSKRSRNRGIDSRRIQPGADALDRPGVAQFRERPPAAGDELTEIGLERGGIFVVPDVEIVHEQKVDRRDPEPLQTVLERPHHPVVAVVVHSLEVQAADPLVPDRAGFQRPAQEPPDLGRDDEVVPLPAVERLAEAMLGQAAAVPGRRIEIAHAAVPRRLDDRRRLVVLDPVEQFPERRGAEAEFGDRDARPPKLARSHQKLAHSSGSVPNRSG